MKEYRNVKIKVWMELLLVYLLKYVKVFPALVFHRFLFLDAGVLQLWRTHAHKALRVHQNCRYTVAGRGVLAY